MERPTSRQFERELERVASLARQRGATQLILRVKRLRNADAVSLEVLDKFLHGARDAGLAVSLAGVRADLLAALRRFGILQLVPSDRVFPEEEQDLSATLKAIRLANASRAGDARPGGPASGAHEGAYYLV